MTDTSEKGLEALIEAKLLAGGYVRRTSGDFNRDFCLDEEMLREFLLATQGEKVARARIFDSPVAERKFLERVKNSVTKRGVVDVLRHGISDNAIDFDMYYPTPSAGNERAQREYEENRFGVVRQLHFSNQTPLDSVDMVLTVNGLPVVTMELKNELSCQDCQCAVKQYKDKRNPKELLFMPKRCAVHLAVDDAEVMMCTKLAGKDSWFLPFNRGCEDGAGNPVNPNGLKTAYLWEEILQKPTLSLILENYAQVIKEKDEDTGKWKEKVIWPRFHQLEAVRALLEDTAEKPIGQRYLIQHSAGSGKSNSITWLAYQLVNQKEADGLTPKFESVLVVTDRVNLDKQIRDNIHAFCNKKDLIAWADDSVALQTALNGGKKIIVTTVCKFPFILQSIGAELKDRQFAVIIDEAHSSQSGSMASALNRILAGFGLQGVDIEDNEDGLDELMEKIVAGRRMASNVNFYAFTATPKNKTLEMFGTPFLTDDGETGHRPFHLYSMRQAIEEGFIMDVLEHYTTYDSFYKILKATESNPEFDKDQANQKLRVWVESRPETVEKKARVMVEHFHEKVCHKIGGEARAMIICAGIERAIDYFYAVKKLLEERNSPYKAVIAFSGTKEYGGKQLDEAALNNFSSSKIEKEFGRGAYRFLIVADKFQTGYDQPLLHTMYVDKPLADIKTVQTLSRLNRCHPKKQDTYVLDFVNKVEDIEEAFQKYYKKTILSHETDVNKLADKLEICEQSMVYEEEEVMEFNEKYWNGADRFELDPILDRCVERFNNLDDDQKIEVKAAMKQFTRLYEFLTSIHDIQRTDWEMKSTFFLFLLRKLPSLPREDWAEGLIELVDFERYRLVKQEEHRIKLENENTVIDPTPTGSAAGGEQTPDMETLERIVDDFNLVFGDIDWSDADLVRSQVKQVVKALQESDDIRDTILNNDAEMQLQVVHDYINTQLGIITANSSEMQRRYLTSATIQEQLDNLVLMRLQQQINPEINEAKLTEKLMDEFAEDFRVVRSGKYSLEDAIEWMFRILETPTIRSLDGLQKLKRTINLVYCTEGRLEDRHDWFKILVNSFEAYLKKIYYMQHHAEVTKDDGRSAQLLDTVKAVGINHLYYNTDESLRKFQLYYNFIYEMRNDNTHQAPTIKDEDLPLGFHATLAMYLYATIKNIWLLEKSESYVESQGYSIAAEGIALR